MSKAIHILLGFSLVLLGYKIIQNPIVCRSFYDNICADFTGYNIPFGVFMMIIGCAIMFHMLFGKRYTGNDILMCHQCNQPIERKQTKGNKCPTCDVELEPLDGFYDRHPELKGK